VNPLRFQKLYNLSLLLFVHVVSISGATFNPYLPETVEHSVYIIDTWMFDFVK